VVCNCIFYKYSLYSIIYLQLHKPQCSELCLCHGRQKTQRTRERLVKDQHDISSPSSSSSLSSESLTAERRLFHGIKWRHLDSVARSNIDWRTMGFSHGVMFGQGKPLRSVCVCVRACVRACPCACMSSPSCPCCSNNVVTCVVSVSC